MTDRERSFDHKRFLRSLSSGPGVYRMLDAAGNIIYVGKARNLKRRVTSYFRKAAQPAKTMRMMEQVTSVEVTVTHTETEALILENNLIKEHRPRYNVLLRDDKSYPYIHLSDHGFPRLNFYRGAKREGGRFFGPYPNASAARETISHLQKLFMLRQCSDTFMNNRTRPCLQYQIHRCTAPCVGYIGREEYARDVESAVKFLEGRNREVIDELVQRMEAASENLEFEKAARYRDQIARLRQAQEKQYVSGDRGDLDVVAAVRREHLICVAVVFIRAGRNLGSKTFFPRAEGGTEPSEVLTAFLPQYYLGRDAPPEILVNHAVEEPELLARGLAEAGGRQVAIRQRVRSDRRQWVRMAEANAEQALISRIATDSTMRQRYEALQEAFELDSPPERLECYDISHTGGEATVASCVVFNRDGPLTSDYRRFNIKGVAAGDDYAAMRQVLERRYTRLKKGEGVMPDVLLVDGGRGQLKQAESVLEELQVDEVLIAAVAKGSSRRPGLERLLLSGRERPIILPPDSAALHLIQHIRDEAHRFAIAGHRHRRGKARRESTLEDIEGLGPKRRQRLLKEFGGLQGIRRAGVEDLGRIHGISPVLAQRIYDRFHGDA